MDEKPSPHDADVTKFGDTVILFVGSFDPPTMEHYRAIEALLSRPEAQHIWVCPLSGSNDRHVRDMASILVNDFSSNGKLVSYCTIALDKKMTDHKQAIEWVRNKFSYLKFQLATVAPDVAPDTSSFFQIAFGQSRVTPQGATGIILDKFAPIPPDLKGRIKAGMDETRNFITPVWDYVQKHRLYRN